MRAKRAHELWEVYRANILGDMTDEGHEAERKAFYFGAWQALYYMRECEKNFMLDVELGVDFSMGLFDLEDDD